jgi:hypothetical protein
MSGIRAAAETFRSYSDLTKPKDLMKIIVMLISESGGLLESKTCAVCKPMAHPQALQYHPAWPYNRLLNFWV